MDTADAFGSLFDEIPDTHTAAAPPQPVQRTAEWGMEPSYDFNNEHLFVGPNAPHPGLDHTMTSEFVSTPSETIDDDPQAALPVTYGDDEDQMAQQIAAALSGPMRASQATVVPARTTHPQAIPSAMRTQAANVLCPKCSSTFAPGQDIEVVAGVGLQHKGPCPYSPPAGQSTASSTPVESDEEKGMRLLAYADAVARGEVPEGPNPFSHLDRAHDNDEIAAAAAAHLAKASGGIQTEALKSYDPAERQAIIEEGMEVRASNLDRLDIVGTHYEALEATGGRVVPDDEDMTFLSGDPNDF